MDIPWFFERLGIAPTQDVKTIKRAYAVALKRIDQVAERQAFETLRKAYELALGWSADGADDEDDTEFEDEADEEDVDAEPDDASQPPAPPAQDALPVGGSPVAGPRQSEPAPQVVVPQPEIPQVTAPDATLAQAGRAIDDWVVRLLAADDAPDVLLAQALRDPNLSHLDSQAQLEAQLADALHQDPEGRVDLFDAAARRFGWTGREDRAFGSFLTAHWISQVVNQGLQWESQKSSARTLQLAALKAAAASDRPRASEVAKFGEALETLHAQFPEWLALRLSAARRATWRDAHAALAARGNRWARWRMRYFGSLSRGIATFAVLSFVVPFVLQMLTLVVREVSGSPPAVAQHAAGKPSTPPASAPVLAYEITGAVTADSCSTAHEFVHESNWLEVDDADAVALLATRAMRCQDKDLWPQKPDALLACLRSERSAALAAGRAEQGARCVSEQKPKGKPP